MYSVDGQHADRERSEGLGSNPNCIEQKENLLKIQRYEKVRKKLERLINLKKS